ncbi:caspase family protein [Halorubrum ezzemoulense]|uniref:Caspase family protein n=1 Tax=Halorubrum ezzemoulense TaxID=337243 RepID=A0ABT4Z8E2_HALEZ|nr:caspase family protein [Halorubrum ezzemoulense]MDB2245144.1 caspase family protein [Halorubrum ezzemoulense]MDB2252630.1 caspase family protein [Halorubrum ezzemoulense]MDB2278098.1 caspase family protein [Halorubrum ezzemoulense]MDB2284772.1 caspase family protein [Halorubrum ezzemoulense]MDB2288480.1 caspase family protein [Halorubrum ezzemoulense]
MSIDIDPLREADGITVTDHIENTQFEVYTDRPVDPRRRPESNHYFPVDASVAVETGAIEIPRVAVVETRGGDGALLTHGDCYEMPDGIYHVGINPAPTKLYLTFESGFSVSTTDRTTRIDLDTPGTVGLGFRSLHQTPAGTITTPTDPESLMDAVSLLGSALQTTSPERSFPTLRGHPPLIEPAEEFRVPERVEPVESGVRIVVPPEYRYLYPVVSLAYYFAADVVPGDAPRIEGDGWTYPLEPGFEERTARVLRQSFHMDCLARTEGFYPVDLHERETTDLDLDWKRLYNLPLAERLGEYLEVPFEDIKPELPQWTLTTDVRPDPENVEMLPFVAGELSIVRSPETVTPVDDDGGVGVGFFGGADRSPSAATRREVPVGGVAPDGGALGDALGDAEFVRGGASAGAESMADTSAGTTRGADASAERGAVSAQTEFVRPEPVDTVEHAWVGDGVPLDANKATLDAYHRRLEAGRVEQSRISVLVVCNDEQMREEGNVADLYGLRDMVQFDIEVRHDLTRAELRETLESDVDFLHYIGHVDDRGMQCADSYLDLTDEDLEIGVSAFLLNACQSYQQGEALVHRGSRGGIVTLSDVANSPATTLGRIIARLMNSGFNLRTALHVAKRELITGHQYIVVGDGGTTICQSRSGIAPVVQLAKSDDGLYSMEIDSYPNGPYGVGTMTTPNVDTINSSYYVPSHIHMDSASKESINQFVELETLPIFLEEKLTWSDRVEL